MDSGCCDSICAEAEMRGVANSDAEQEESMFFMKLRRFIFVHSSYK
jgi:hypothetical protein